MLGGAEDRREYELQGSACPTLLVEVALGEGVGPLYTEPVQAATLLPSIPALKPFRATSTSTHLSAPPAWPPGSILGPPGTSSLGPLDLAPQGSSLLFVSPRWAGLIPSCAPGPSQDFAVSGFPRIVYRPSGVDCRVRVTWSWWSMQECTSLSPSFTGRVGADVRGVGIASGGRSGGKWVPARHAVEPHLMLVLGCGAPSRP